MDRGAWRATVHGGRKELDTETGATYHAGIHVLSLFLVIIAIILNLFLCAGSAKFFACGISHNLCNMLERGYCGINISAINYQIIGLQSPSFSYSRSMLWTALHIGQLSEFLICMRWLAKGTKSDDSAALYRLSQPRSLCSPVLIALCVRCCGKDVCCLCELEPKQGIWVTALSRHIIISFISIFSLSPPPPTFFLLPEKNNFLLKKKFIWLC